MSQIISEILGVPFPKVYAPNVPFPKVYAPKTAATAIDFIPAPALLYGVELEIENCGRDMQVAGMRVETDGSLRNNGLEFITEPMVLSNLIRCLTSFFAKNKLTTLNYSERTSIHVHTNCTDLTPTQVASICVVYQVFEKVLFNFIGNDRSRNIFCVPWSETTVNFRTVNALLKNDLYMSKDWHKYTALNLNPLSTYGTIEWRHMEGTCDLEKIILWLQIIGSIYAYATSMEYEDVLKSVIGLNTTSQYNTIFSLVFGRFAEQLKYPGYDIDIEDGVLNMKYSIAAPNKKIKMSWHLPPVVDNFAEFFTNPVNVIDDVQDDTQRNADAGLTRVTI
jgi:hypothetical protein